MDAITKTEFKQKFVEREHRIPAWHKLGTVFAADETRLPSEACRDIHADNHFSISQTHVQLDDGTYVATGGYQVIRNPLYRDGKMVQGMRSIAPCTKDWKPVDPMVICQAFDPASKYYRLETMGSLDDDAIFFCTLKADNFAVQVNGQADEHAGYIYLIDYHYPGHAFIVGAGSTRIVCMNTLISALGSAQFSVPLPHTGDVRGVITTIGQALSSLGSKQQALQQAYSQLAAVPMTDETFEALAMKVWAAPGKPKLVVALDTLTESGASGGVADAIANAGGVKALRDEKMEGHEARTDQMKTLRGLAKLSFENMADTDKLGKSLYTGLQAVIEVCQHRAVSKRGAVESDMVTGGRGMQIWRAIEYVQELAGMKTQAN